MSDAKVRVESHSPAAAREIGGLHLALNPGHVVEVVCCEECGGTPIGLWCVSCVLPLCAIDEAAP
jgi:hypothetical protein